MLHVDDGASAFHGLESAVKQFEFVNDHRLVALDCLAGEERVQGLSSDAMEVMVLGHRMGACTILVNALPLLTRFRLGIENYHQFQCLL